MTVRSAGNDALERMLETALAECEQCEQQLATNPPNPDGIRNRLETMSQQVVELAHALAVCDIAFSLQSIGGDIGDIARFWASEPPGKDA